MAKEYLDKSGMTYWWSKLKLTFASISHTHTKSQITDFPSIPANTSDLTNDSNFVSDANYVHTDNNYTTTEKNKLAGIDMSTKQDVLVSGTNIKTVNNQSLLGSGNLSIGGGGGSSDYDQLSNRPEINSVLLTGDKSFADLGLIDFFYPVGSYYETSDSTFNPNTAWGGTWSLEAEGLVHIGAGSNYTIGDTGGEAEHLLTGAESGQKAITITGGGHEHKVHRTANHASSGSARYTIQGTTDSSYADTFGGGTHSHSVSAEDATNAHNNMQPYIVVNRWHRTA